MTKKEFIEKWCNVFFNPMNGSQKMLDIQMGDDIDDLVHDYYDNRTAPTSWMDLTLQQIISEYKDGEEEVPLDGDEVEDLINIIRTKINLHQGNITQEEYDRLLG